MRPHVKCALDLNLCFLSLCLQVLYGVDIWKAADVSSLLLPSSILITSPLSINVILTNLRAFANMVSSLGEL